MPRGALFQRPEGWGRQRPRQQTPDRQRSRTRLHSAHFAQPVSDPARISCRAGSRHSKTRHRDAACFGLFLPISVYVRIRSHNERPKSSRLFHRRSASRRKSAFGRAGASARSNSRLAAPDSLVMTTTECNTSEADNGVERDERQAAMPAWC